MRAVPQKPIISPFTGIVSSVPKPYTPPNSFDDLINFFLYRGRLLTRNRSVAFSVVPDGANVYAMIPFNDIMQNPHNLVLTGKNAWMLTSGPTWHGPLKYQTWSSAPTYAQNDAVNFAGTTYVAISSNTNNQPNLNPSVWAAINPAVVNSGIPYGITINGGRVYYSNGSVIGSYSDGESTIKSMLHPGSFLFIGGLGQHLVTANTIEPAPQVIGSVAFPLRVRWSDTGNPTNWVEGGSSTAGHIDLLDVPDAISGYLTLGRTGYIFRTNGITMMTPTGLGSAPFQFDPVSQAPEGAGNFYSNSLDQWNSMAIFVSKDDIYTFDTSTFSNIGGDARDLIFADIAASPPEQVIGTLVVRFNAQFLLLSYWLMLPSSASGTHITSGQPVTWIYFFDTKGWCRFSSTQSNNPIQRLTAISQMSV